MSLKQDLEQWDGKSSDDINEVYGCYHSESEFLSDIIQLIKPLSTQKGASWLLKKYLETKGKLSPAEAKKIYTQLPNLDHWEAKLHLLQSIAFIPIGKREKERVVAFLRICLADSNKFVRAWAYSGFYELSLQYSDFQEEAEKFFKMAMKDEAPSVKARIRNIMKQSP